MADDDVKDWKQLCSQASVEQDPKKLLEIIAELEKALDQRRHQDRLESQRRKPA